LLIDIHDEKDREAAHKLLQRKATIIYQNLSISGNEPGKIKTNEAYKSSVSVSGFDRNVSVSDAQGEIFKSRFVM
jgi:hypothetical protein